jgi:glycerophosphoryl diester phosphodiesterase
MMTAVETKASRRRIIISGAEAQVSLRRFLGSKEPAVQSDLLRLWKTQAAMISEKEIRDMMGSGQAPHDFLVAFERMNADAFNEKIGPAAIAGLESAADEIGRRMKRVLPKSDFLPRIFIQEFVNQRGASLITRLNQDMKDAVSNILKQYVVQEPLGYFQLSRMIRANIGLTEQFSNAVAKRYESLIADGLSADRALADAEKYAAFLHKVRAMNIARTELAEAYGEGQIQVLRNARDEGLVTAPITKTWACADDERTCAECSDLDGEQVGLDDEFSSGDDRTPAHCSCRCSIQYEILEEI